MNNKITSAIVGVVMLSGLAVGSQTDVGQKLIDCTGKDYKYEMTKRYYQSEDLLSTPKAGTIEYSDDRFYITNVATEDLETTCEGVRNDGENLKGNYWVDKAKESCYQAGVTREEVSKIINQYKDVEN